MQDRREPQSLSGEQTTRIANSVLGQIQNEIAQKSLGGQLSLGLQDIVTWTTAVISSSAGYTVELSRRYLSPQTAADQVAAGIAREAATTALRSLALQGVQVGSPNYGPVVSQLCEELDTQGRAAAQQEQLSSVDSQEVVNALKEMYQIIWQMSQYSASSEQIGIMLRSRDETAGVTIENFARQNLEEIVNKAVNLQNKVAEAMSRFSPPVQELSILAQRVEAFIDDLRKKQNQLETYAHDLLQVGRAMRRATTFDQLMRAIELHSTFLDRYARMQVDRITLASVSSESLELVNRVREQVKKFGKEWLVSDWNNYFFNMLHTIEGYHFFPDFLRQLQMVADTIAEQQGTCEAEQYLFEKLGENADKILNVNALVQILRDPRYALYKLELNNTLLSLNSIAEIIEQTYNAITYEKKEPDEGLTNYLHKVIGQDEFGITATAIRLIRPKKISSAEPINSGQKPTRWGKFVPHLRREKSESYLETKDFDLAKHIVITVGRAQDQKFRIADTDENGQVSRNHMDIYVQDGILYILDRSSNGVYIDNQQIKKGLPLVIHRLSDRAPLRQKVRLGGSTTLLLETKHDNSILTVSVLPKIQQ